MLWPFDEVFRGGNIGGHGERTFTGVQRAVRGGLNASSLTDSLRLLADKRMVTADEPLSCRPGSKDRRYRVADPGLRFWLAFVEPALSEVDRGRPDLSMSRVQAGYPSCRGRAIEPVVRAALARMTHSRWPGLRHIGGWWPRTNRPEVDLVGADRIPAHEISFVGTIKWRAAAAITVGEAKPWSLTRCTCLGSPRARRWSRSAPPVLPAPQGSTRRGDPRTCSMPGPHRRRPGWRLRAT
jgi:Archaea bacterial proteins of unknown function